MRRRWVITTLVALAVAGVVAAVLVARDGSDAERRAVIDAEIAGIWQAGGVAVGDVDDLAHEFTRRPGATGCDGLPEGEHWFATRTSVANVAAGDEQRLVDTVTGWLDEHGYTTYRYGTPYGNSLVDGVDNGRDLRVRLIVQRGGAADVRVRLSPCSARPYRPPDPVVWTPVGD